MNKLNLLCLLFAGLIVSSCKKSRIYEVEWELETEGVKRYTINDRYVVIDSIGYGPENEKITVFDKNGKLQGWAGTTSESCCYEIVRYVYDDSNQKTIGVVSTCADEDEIQTDDIDEMIRGTKDLVIKRILSDDEHESYTTWYDFKWGGNYIVEVFDHTSDSRSIKAGNGNHIEYEVAENDSFWASDMFGGRVVLLFHIVPNNTNIEEYTIDTYYGYDLQMKSTFKDGFLCERRIFINNDGSTKCAVGRMVKNGDEHTYRFTDSNECPWEYTYENGVLKHKDYLSQYGTVIKQDTYFLSQDKEAYIHFHKEYDYKNKKLVKTEEERIDKDTFLEENSERDALKMHYDLQEGWSFSYFSGSVIANGN